jgi:hypothetical protein
MIRLLEKKGPVSFDADDPFGFRGFTGITMMEQIDEFLAGHFALIRVEERPVRHRSESGEVRRGRGDGGLGGRQRGRRVKENGQEHPWQAGAAEP